MTGQPPDVIEEVQRLIAALESHPDAAVGEQVTALLEGIDVVHRTALTHLVHAIRGMAGEAFINKLTADPAIRLLLMSYDLLAVDRRLLAEEALDLVRGHLHAHGVDVELLEVVGGVVYVRLYGMDESSDLVERVKHDLEEALRADFIGFQELVVRGRDATEPTTTFVQLGGLRRAQRPVYRRALATGDLAPGQMRDVDLNGHPVLIANVDGELYAVRNRCDESPLPLEFSELRGAELRCSWHGCRYDIRTGQRLDSLAGRLAVFPVMVEEGEIKVAVGIEPVGDDTRGHAGETTPGVEGTAAGAG